MSKLVPIFIEATTLDDAWHQCLFNLFDYGRKYIIDDGSYKGSTRLEFDYVTIHIKTPWAEPRLPQIPTQLNIPAPCDEQYVVNYFNRYIIGSEVTENETYTYGSRLTVVKDAYDRTFNQIEEIITRIKQHGEGNNQLVLQVAQPSDLWLSDPPCLRHIDVRLKNGTLHFFPYFRSWDLWGGFPANLAAIQLLKEYMVSQIDCIDGEIIVTSKGLHIYKHVEELAKLRAYK